MVTGKATMMNIFVSGLADPDLTPQLILEGCTKRFRQIWHVSHSGNYEVTPQSVFPGTILRK
jgi:hypothetical protein